MCISAANNILNTIPLTFKNVVDKDNFQHVFRLTNIKKH